MPACPQQFADSGADPRALDPNAAYAVAPSPFFAFSVAPTSSRDDDDASITLSVTANTEVPARRLSLPLWFATEFLKFRDVASLSSDSPHDTVFVHQPKVDIDVAPGITIGTSQHLDGMIVVAGLSPKDSVEQRMIGGQPSAGLLGTAEERTAFASTSAALIFTTLNTVPHCVVPSLVLAFVIAPYAAEVHCTMEEGMLGVTEVTQVELTTPSLDLSRLPNLTKLSMDTSFHGTLPPCLTTLVLKADHFPDLHSAPYLTSLTLTDDPPLDHLVALVDAPVGSVRRLTLHSLTLPSESESDGRARLECLGRLFPNVESLCFPTASCALNCPKVRHVLKNEDCWPALHELDAAVSVVATIAWMRPHGWRRVTLRSSEFLWYAVVNLPDTLHLSLGSAVHPETLISSPSLRTLYLESDGDGNRLPPPKLAVPHLEHVLIDTPVPDNSLLAQLFLNTVAAAAGPSVRFVTCRPGAAWERSSENVWVEGAVVPPGLDPGDVSIPDDLVVPVRDPRSIPPPPREMCQCLLVPK